MTKKKRKKYSREFKEEAIRLLETRGSRSVAEVAESLGVAPNMLHGWRRQLGSVLARDRGETPEEEVRRLRRENAELKRDREALLKSLGVAVRSRK